MRPQVVGRWVEWVNGWLYLIAGAPARNALRKGGAGAGR